MNSTSADIEKQLPSFILQLIEENGHAMLPGVGYFFVLPSSAKITNKLLEPSLQTLSFRSDVHKYDTALPQLVSNTFGISMSKARIELLKIADKIFQASQHSLNNEYHFGNLGVFKFENNQLNFIQNRNVLASEFFGLEPILLTPVKRSEIVYTPVKPIKEIKISKTKYRPVYYKLMVAASFIGILLVLGLLFSKQSIKALELQSANFFNISTNKPLAETPGLKTLPTDLIDHSKPRVNLLPSNDLPYTTLSDNTLENGFYVIIGSFSEENNASKLHNTLVKQGKSKTIIKQSSNGFYRVGYFLTSSYKDYYNLALQEQEKHADCWFLRID